MTDSLASLTFTAPDPAELAPYLPGYEISALIATGGMGAVYHAVQKSLERDVAIKILPQEFSTDASFCQSFEAEAKAMARLNHPNLIGVFDFGEVNGMPFIVMEFVPGKSLFHSAHGVAIAADEVVRLVTGICEGLAHAHDNGIIHRDIKPSNILLDLNANPKIGDFGLARTAGRSMHDGGEIFGTPHYTAPEVVNAPHSVDYRADIYSVGVMLHELLTGKLPADDWRPASAIIHCSPRFDRIIHRATNPDPAARYSSARDMAAELRAVTAPAATRVPSTPRANILPPRRPIQTQKSSSSGALILIFVLVAIAGGLWYYRNSQQAAPESPDVPPPVAAQPKPTNVVPPVPTPIPLPPPEPDPIATQPDQPEPDNSALPDHSLPETTIPTFDVEAFLAKARKIMNERADPLLRAHDDECLKNISGLEKDMERAIRKIESRWVRDIAVSEAETFLNECREDNNRINPNLPETLKKNPEIRQIHDRYSERELLIEKRLRESLGNLTPTYVLGIEKQIERLKPDTDTQAIEELGEEIRKAKADEEYFPDLILEERAESL